MKKQYDIAVINGRYQPFHAGHMSCVIKGLAIADRVLIIIGSGNAYPSTENPFTVNERSDMIFETLRREIPDDAHRVDIDAVGDSLYQEWKWQSKIRGMVRAYSPVPDAKVAMVGIKKDKASYWLETFMWDFVEADPVHVGDKFMSATDIRKMIFEQGMVPASIIGPVICQKVLSWMKGDEYTRLKTEYQYKKKELEKFKDYPYRACLNCCTADALVVCNGHLLVVRRGGPIGNGALALVGGHKNEDETFVQCAIRELKEETKLKIPEKVLYGSIKRKEIFDNPNRSFISKPTMALLIEVQPNHDGTLPEVRGADDAAEAFWLTMDKVAFYDDEWFEDHYSIIQEMLGL